MKLWVPDNFGGGYHSGIYIYKIYVYIKLTNKTKKKTYRTKTKMDSIFQFNSIKRLYLILNLVTLNCFYFIEKRTILFGLTCTFNAPPQHLECVGWPGIIITS